MAETTEKTPPEHEMKNRRRLVGFFLFPIALFPLLALISYRWQAIAELNLPPEASSNLIGVVSFSAFCSSWGGRSDRGAGSSRFCCSFSLRHACCSC